MRDAIQVISICIVIRRMEPLLPRYLVQSRCNAPASGIRCPEELRVAMAANRLSLLDTTTNGNCGLDAAIKSLQTVGKVERTLTSREAYKELMRHKASDDGMIQHLRSKMVAWMTKNGNMEMWDGMAFSQIALAMSSGHKSYASYLEYMGTDRNWIDAACLHAIGNIFKVDFAVLQLGMDPCFVGT